ncbi:hypothetical protein C7S16_2703 [Burkholderia thailandensis]|uniref:Uncharacterized protein n=1 Tax=Burkholderia thailandensis TaxID=57975 RepID=A0AAW9CVX6_BURTH|nr:hypothetical protein [Burkholderia thailandensis]
MPARTAAAAPIGTRRDAAPAHSPSAQEETSLIDSEVFCR